MPYEAVDGYFRIVLDGSESTTVPCPSPVFRIASTSVSAGSFESAATLSVELSVKVGPRPATTIATKVVTPWAAVVQDRIATIKGKDDGHASTNGMEF